MIATKKATIGRHKRSSLVFEPRSSISRLGVARNTIPLRTVIARKPKGITSAAAPPIWGRKPKAHEHPYGKEQEC